MGEIWRRLDTGLATPGQHVALDRALLESRAAGEIPDTLRFARSTRSVHLGVQQSAAQVLDLEYCDSHKIPIQRRLTGGPAFFADERQLIFELYLDRRDAGSADLRTLSKRICHAAAAAMSALGIDAQHRAHNEVEVDGRMLLTSSCTIEGSAILFQAILFVDVDPLQAVKCMRIAGREIVHAEAAARVVSIRDLVRKTDAGLIKHYIAEAFESEFDVEFREADLELTESARYDTALRQVETPDWMNLVAGSARDAPLLHATLQRSDGVLAIRMLYERATQRIRDIWFTGAAATLRETLAQLESALRGAAVSDLDERVQWFFKSRPVKPDVPSPQEIILAVRHALRDSTPARN